MSRVRYNTHCPRCRENGRDSRGDNLSVYDDGGMHCWSCAYHVFPKHITFFNDPINKQVSSLLPYDWTREIPNHAWQWLLQWGLPASYWKESVGYSPSQERLVFRVGDTYIKDGVLQRNDSTLAFSIGREIHDPNKQNSEDRSIAVQTPPWWGVLRDNPLRQGGTTSVQRTTGRTKKWYVWGDCHRHAEVVGESPSDKGGYVVLVEDLISAHKVAAAGFTCIPLFGTKIHNPVIYYLMNTNKKIKLWLDKDQEGNVKRQAIHLQVIVGNPVDVVVTDQDPKALSINKIKEVIV